MLLTLHDVFTVNGQLETIDRGTGQKVQRCLITVAATRDEFQGLVLDKLDPQACLRHLNALISPNPYDVEPVRPLFEPDLSRFRLADAEEVAARLDSRAVLAQLTLSEFEHLIRELFEQIGMQAWVTQASRDDGVDAVAVNPDRVLGGLSVHPSEAIQERRSYGSRPGSLGIDGGPEGRNRHPGHDLVLR